MIDGWPHCPETPDRLAIITRPAHLSVPALKKTATEVERAEHAEKLRVVAEFQAAIAERETWAFRRTAGPTRTGRSTSSARAGPAGASASTARSRSSCPRGRRRSQALPRLLPPPRRATSAPSPSRAMSPRRSANGSTGAAQSGRHRSTAAPVPRAASGT